MAAVHNDAGDADGEVPEGILVEEREEAVEARKPVVFVETKEKPPPIILHLAEGRRTIRRVKGVWWQLEFSPRFRSPATC